MQTVSFLPLSLNKKWEYCVPNVCVLFCAYELFFSVGFILIEGGAYFISCNSDCKEFAIVLLKCPSSSIQALFAATPTAASAPRPPRVQLHP